MNISEIIELVKSARPIICDRAAVSEVEEKGLDDFVTRVDTTVQKYIKGRLASMYPEIQFMGEEGGKESIDFSRPVWILDPIDGTTNLIHDYQMSAVSLALVENNEPVLGVVYNPFHDELYHAEKGRGAYLNGMSIRVTDAGCMADSLIAIGTSPYEKALADRNFDLFREIFKASQDIRRGGSAALDLCYLAAGRIDGYCEMNLKPWDFAAGCVILTEAGGRVSDYCGNGIDFSRNSDILASNLLIHDEFMGIIKKEFGEK